MIDHKFTDEQIIRCLNECYGKEHVVAHIVDHGEEETVTLGRIVEIINRQRGDLIKEFAARLRSHYPHTQSILNRIDRIEKEMTEGTP